LGGQALRSFTTLAMPMRRMARAARSLRDQADHLVAAFGDVDDHRAEYESERLSRRASTERLAGVS
jgi:hypothetical protein